MKISHKDFLQARKLIVDYRQQQTGAVNFGLTFRDYTNAKKLWQDYGDQRAAAERVNWGRYVDWEKPRGKTPKYYADRKSALTYTLSDAYRDGDIPDDVLGGDK